MNLQNIKLISFGYFDTNFLKKIEQNIRSEYSSDIKIVDGRMDLTRFYDTERRQYNGNLLINEIENNFASDKYKTIGLFNIDLFIPIFTYIFGQAFLNGRSGIVSIYRLSNEKYGIKEDPKLLIDRFSKEIIHELGHTFGLIHCLSPDCVMRSGTYVEDIDQKGIKLCDNCRKILHKEI